MSYQIATAPEWRVLEAVHPLLAATIPWELADPERRNGDAVAAARIDIGNLQEMFQSEMRFLLLNLPESEIPADSFELCLRSLMELLLFLESLVLDLVIEPADAMEQPEEEEEVSLSCHSKSSRFLTTPHWL